MADFGSTARVASAIAMALVVAVTVSGCRSAGVAPDVTATTTQVQAVPFDLYTHCGINELSINGKYFQHVGGTLSDGSGNPPSGWDNPYQHGILSVSGGIAVFRDDHGHHETFKVRTGATAFQTICS